MVTVELSVVTGSPAASSTVTAGCVENAVPRCLCRLGGKDQLAGVGAGHPTQCHADDGLVQLTLPRSSRTRASPKLKIPPSEATSQ